VPARKKYVSAAEKQRAYRQRKKQRADQLPDTDRPLSLPAIAEPPIGLPSRLHTNRATLVLGLEEYERLLCDLRQRAIEQGMETLVTRLSRMVGDLRDLQSLLKLHQWWHSFSDQLNQRPEKC
jgi:hypothetical protein